MLTVEELELAEKRDSNYIANNYYPDLAENEMKFPKSDARFVGAIFFRESLTKKIVILTKHFIHLSMCCVS